MKRTQGMEAKSGQDPATSLGARMLEKAGLATDGLVWTLSSVSLGATVGAARQPH